jgi:hypothetical protein
MAFPDLFKLEKLKIHAYSAKARSGEPFGTFTAMFNPETLSREYSLVYHAAPVLKGPPQPPRVIQSPPSNLNLKLLLDGSGVNDVGLASLLAPCPPVDEQIASFLALTYGFYKKAYDTYEPNYLRVVYGDFKFDCRLAKVTIAYSSFDRHGKTVRAELDVNLISDEAAERPPQANNPASPDMSQSRVVREGDTLPSLTKTVYGSSRHHLAVARANGLDHVRSLPPGRELLFPPLAR